MEELWDQLLGYFVIGFSFFQIVLSVALHIFNTIFAVYWLLGSIKIVKREGKIRRGYRLWSKPLMPDQLQYLKSLPNGMIEQSQDRTFLLARSALLVMKSNNEVMIAGGNRMRSTSISFSNQVYMAIVIGYVNLSRAEPRLEFRVPPPKIWVGVFILLNLLNIILNLPFGLLFFIIPFLAFLTNMEGIENFLRNKAAAQNKSTMSS